MSRIIGHRQLRAPRRRFGTLRRLFKGFLYLSLCILVAAGAATYRASIQLDHRFQNLKSEIQLRRHLESQPRKVLVGSTTEGNALLDYNGIHWASNQMPKAWVADPPPLPPDAEELRRRLEQVEQSGTMWDELRDHMTGGTKPSSLSFLEYKAYHALTKYARSGIRRRHCDWEFEYERGHWATPINLIPFRLVSQLFAYEAHLDPSADRAARTGCEILALGRDVHRNPHCLSVPISVAIQRDGFASLARTLEHRELEVDTYRRILAVLQQLHHGSSIPSVLTDHLLWQVDIFRSRGCPLDPLAPVPESTFAWRPGEQFRFASQLMSSKVAAWFAENELQGIDDYIGVKSVQVSALPYWELIQGTTLKETKDPRYFLASQVGLNVDYFEISYSEIQALRGLTRMAAAVGLYRAIHGGLPRSGGALESVLGPIPTDPFDPNQGPLKFVYDRGQVTLYSVWINSEDDGGHGHSRRHHRDVFRPVLFGPKDLVLQLNDFD